MVPLSSAVELTRGKSTQTGVLLIQLRYSALTELFSHVSLGSNGYVYLTDSDGCLLYHPFLQRMDGKQETAYRVLAEKGDGAYEEVIEGRRCAVLVRTAGYTGWRILGVVSQTGITFDSAREILLVLVIFSAFFLLLTVANFFLSRQLTDPIRQLEVCGEKLGLPVFQMGQTNPVDIAKAAVQHAIRHGNDMVFLDTAGRLHIDETLMEELKAVKAAVNPQEIMLVVDAMTGQDAVNAAQSFNEWLDIDSVMLTKLDGDARGGAALSVRAVTGKPIKFVGTGEKLENIEAFHPDRMASRILGMGDVLSLIEKAEKAYDAKKAAELEEKLRSNKFTLADFYDQLVQLKSMGSMQEILAQLPGGANMKDVKVDEKAMTRTEAIILSMTPKERDNPSIINASRKQRIAQGAGVRPQDVNSLLSQFETMRKLVRQFSGPGAGKKMKRMGRMKGMPGGIPGL